MVKIIKSDGATVDFDIKRIEQTLTKLKTDQKVKSYILNKLQKNIKEGMTTKQIYGIVFGYLKRDQRKIASKYSLKKAIADLGPEGYNFEDFIARILNEKGYETKTRQIFDGEVVKHEIDVLAKKGKWTYIVECKYHNNPHANSSIQTPLYMYARFLDILNAYKKGINPVIINGAMICTNTRFSKDSILYARSKDIRLLSWDYPSKSGIKDIVDKKALYPVTVLTTLSKMEKSILLRKGIILVKQITENDVRPKVMAEVKELLENDKLNR